MKINGCLKCLFVFFNVLFAIIGCLLIYGTVKATIVSSQLSAFGGPSLGWGWVFAIGVLGISCLGIYAACSEKVLALKIFAGFMGVGMVIMLIFGIVVVVARNKIRDNYNSVAEEVAKQIQNDDGLRQTLEAIQLTLQCCGVVRAEDWGSDIPQSCECNTNGPLGKATCKAKPQGTTGPSQIYDQPCGTVIYSWIDIAFQVFMGICFGFAVTALMGLLVSLLMIHQIKRYDNVGGASIAMKGY
ncbi:tetraspanin-8 [Lates calcarifer]|uniref:Tetraspanin n=1 Tax=Lates calcarifer TaxID=8187 RepID=A0AAJ7Q9Q1_LATCA|nr:tetraspanin-8 [Lates calcarifer]